MSNYNDVTITIRGSDSIITHRNGCQLSRESQVDPPRRREQLEAPRCGKEKQGRKRKDLNGGLFVRGPRSGCVNAVGPNRRSKWHSQVVINK